VGSDFVGTPIDAQIQSMGNGWYRCSIVVNTADNNCRIYPADADGDLSGTSGNIYIQDAQLETGDIATDYIATTAAAVSVGPVSGLPRLDYLGSSCPRLLLEPQRTNTMLNSEALNSWLKLDTSATSNTAVSPSGYADADTATATGNAPHLIYQNLAFTSGTAYTLSVFAKANTSDYIQLVLAGQFSATNYANFDLSNGTITASAFVTAKIEDYGNGWYRCSVSATAPSSATNSQIVYLINSPTAPRAQSFNASGESVYLWGGQFEAGAYGTSYIPTLGAAVTRLADAASKTGISSFIGQTEGVLYAEVDVRNLTAAKVPLQVLQDADNRFGLAIINTGSSLRFQGYCRIGGTFTAVIDYDAPLVGGVYKLSLGYAPNDWVLYVNGIQRGTNTTSSVPTTSICDVGSVSGTYILDDRLAQALLFKTRLSNAQLAELTTL